MFGFFRRRPKYTAEQALTQLGEAAQGFVSAASSDNDVAVALKGAATVAAIIKESDRCYGFEVQDGTVFANFVVAIREKDLATMATMTKEMASALGQVKGPILRGGLVYFWIKGQRLGT